MSDHGDADLLQVFRRQIGQHLVIDFVVTKCGLVLFEAEVAQPAPDIHGRTPTGSDTSSFGWKGVSRALLMKTASGQGSTKALSFGLGLATRISIWVAPFVRS